MERLSPRFYDALSLSQHMPPPQNHWKLSVFKTILFTKLGDDRGKHYRIKSHFISLQRNLSYLFSYFQITSHQVEGFMRPSSKQKKKKIPRNAALSPTLKHIS